MSKKLYQIISRVFNIDNSKINDETSPENLEEWDSFNFSVLLDEITTPSFSFLDLFFLLEISFLIIESA